MARPQGHELSRDAWEDIIRFSGKSLTEIATLSGIPRASLSSLVGGHHRASIPQAHKLSRALGCQHVGTLFPSLRGTPVAQVA